MLNPWNADPGDVLADAAVIVPGGKSGHVGCPGIRWASVTPAEAGRERVPRIDPGRAWRRVHGTHIPTRWSGSRPFDGPTVGYPERGPGWSRAGYGEDPADRANHEPG